MEAVDSKISVEEINNAGITIKEQAKKMYDSLQKVQEIMKDSKSCFDSEEGNELRQKFEKTAADFASFRQFLESYGNFCENFSGNVKKFKNAVEEATAKIP